MTDYTRANRYWECKRCRCTCTDEPFQLSNRWVCWLCYDNQRRDWLQSLATNLHVAAALCHAFELGVKPRYFTEEMEPGMALRPYAQRWWPGCGREAPGWEAP